MDNNKHQKITLSVRLMTYNHESYIARAIEGALDQKTDFIVEIVIGDDFSTDRTPEIIQSYAEQYPENIIYLQREAGGEYQQLRKKHGRIYNFYDIMQNCRGKYIAILDGDDFWTDSNKLQKQVDFLEKNPQYAFCCHAYSRYDEKGEFIESMAEDQINQYPNGFEIDLQIFFKEWVTQTVTTVIRSGVFQFELKRYSIINDFVLFYATLLKNKGYFLPFNASGYTIHDKSVFAGQDKLTRCIYNYQVKKNIAIQHPDEHLINNQVIRDNYKIVRHLLQRNRSLKIFDLQLLIQCYSLLADSKWDEESKSFVYDNIVYSSLVRLKMIARAVIDKEYRNKHFG